MSTILHEATMPYQVERLTATEYSILVWLSKRGYDAGVLDASGVESVDETTGDVQLGTMEEWRAWEVLERSEQEGYLACNGSVTLRDKLRRMLDKIV